MCLYNQTTARIGMGDSYQNQALDPLRTLSRDGNILQVVGNDLFLQLNISSIKEEIIAIHHPDIGRKNLEKFLTVPTCIMDLPYGTQPGKLCLDHKCEEEKWQGPKGRRSNISGDIFGDTFM